MPAKGAIRSSQLESNFRRFEPLIRQAYDHYPNLVTFTWRGSGLSGPHFKAAFYDALAAFSVNRHWAPWFQAKFHNLPIELRVSPIAPDYFVLGSVSSLEEFFLRNPGPAVYSDYNPLITDSSSQLELSLQSELDLSVALDAVKCYAYLVTFGEQFGWNLPSMVVNCPGDLRTKVFQTLAKSLSQFSVAVREVDSGYEIYHEPPTSQQA